MADDFRGKQNLDLPEIPEPAPPNPIISRAVTAPPRAASISADERKRLAAEQKAAWNAKHHAERSANVSATARDGSFPHIAQNAGNTTPVSTIAFLYKNEDPD